MSRGEATVRACGADPAGAIRAFESGQIDAEGFDHAEHIRTAWCYLQEFPTAIAIARFTAALRSLTESLGMAYKYHETISWFFMIVIADRCARLPAANWNDFRARNADLFTNGAALLHRHYSPEYLASAAARRRFVLPDRACQQSAQAPNHA